MAKISNLFKNYTNALKNVTCKRYSKLTKIIFNEVIVEKNFCQDVVITTRQTGKSFVRLLVLAMHKMKTIWLFWY